MTDRLQQLGAQLPAAKNPGNPPLHLWQPPLSGDIDIVIRADGSWIHEGRPIQRHTLVRLFASILRREEDGDYYLVTPVEKWRIKVELLPLLIVDFWLSNPGSKEQELWVRTNTDRELRVDARHPLLQADETLAVGQDSAEIPVIQLDHGLAGIFNRATWYRLVDAAEDRESGPGILSCGVFYSLIAQAA